MSHQISAASQSFAALGVPAPLVRVLDAQGITSAFPIQSATLPDSLAGRDVLGRGRTGSGKTIAFALPLIARLASAKRPRQSGRPRALILAPTRELALQIEAVIAPLADAMSLRTMTVFGGVKPGPQQQKLRAGVDVVIACPGRLEDHLRGGYVRLDAVEITILDEADHMADLGFLPGVKRILDATPRSGQRMLFSATLDNAIDVLVKRYLSNPVTHSVDSVSSPVGTMTHHVLHVAGDARLPVIADLAAAPGRTVIFTRTKHGAKALTRQLNARGVEAIELHGNLSQGARTRNLAKFSADSDVALVCTDIAARGIHVDDVELVVHADPPIEHKAYLHRSGRTARAGSAGTVVTMMIDAQVRDVRDLTRKAGIKPTITKAGLGHPVLTQIAPGERTFGEPIVVAKNASTRNGSGAGRAGGRARNGSQTARQGGRLDGRSSSGEPRTRDEAGSRSARSGGRGQGGGPARGSSGGAPRGGGRRTSGGFSSHSAASFSSRSR